MVDFLRASLDLHPVNGQEDLMMSTYCATVHLKFALRVSNVLPRVCSIIVVVRFLFETIPACIIGY